jgi:hypothetical protein
MIRNLDHARAVAASAEAFLGELSAAFEAARATESPAEFEKLKLAVGQVVGSLEAELLWPLYKLHPELEPENLKGWESGA